MNAQSRLGVSFQASLLVIGQVLLALFLYTIGLSIGPRVSGDALDAVSPSGARLNCLTAIDLPGPFGILLNCDSPAFMEAATHPGKLLEQNSQRQERPGQIWLAWLISRPLLPIASALGQLGKRPDVGLPEGATRTKAQAIADLAPGFIAFYLLNIAILIASVFLLRSAASTSASESDVVTLSAAVLLFNDVTKAYLVTPHSQLMNILVPMVMMWTLFRWLDGKGVSVSATIALSMIAGLGVLTYPTWVLVPAVLVLGVLWSLWHWADASRPGHALLLVPVTVALVAVPYLLWYLYVLKNVGSFYTHAVAHDGALVWLLGDPVKVVSRFGGNLASNLSYASAQAVPYLVLALPAVVVLGRRRITLREADVTRLKRSASGATMISLIFLVFFALVGFKVWRYAFPSIPAWSVPLAILNAAVFRQMPDGRERALYKLSLLIIATGIAVTYVVKDGPWG